MAVKFLTSLDVAGDGAAAATAVGITLNNTQLQKFKVENRANDAAYTPASGAGQMYWNTTEEDMRYWDGTDWVIFGSAGAGINNINATTNGTSLTTSNTLTGNGTLTLQWQGNGTTQYVDGAGGLKLLSSLPQGIVTSIGDGVYTTVGGTAAVPVVNHDLTSQSNTTPSTTITSTFTALSANVGVNSTGHVTGQTLTTYTLPASDNYSSWTLDGDTGTPQPISSGQTALFEGGTGVSTLVSATDTLTITNTKPFDDFKTAADTGTSTITNQDTVTIEGGTGITTSDDGSGTITINATGSGQMTSWTLAGSSGSPQTITNTNTATFLQGNGITTVASATDNLTITNVKPFDKIVLAGSSGTDSDITNNDTLSILAGANISTTGNGTDGVTIAYTGGTGTMSSWILDGDTGTPQTISNGNTALFEGGTNINTVVSATDTLRVNLDNSIILSGSVSVGTTLSVGNLASLTGGFSAGADSSMGSNKITNLATGSADNDAVNVAQLAAAVAGSARFRGGYNANTGLTTDLGAGNGSLDGASNIALELGDFFIVTTDGNAFYSTTLEVGDTIYANHIIAANSTPAESSYTVVIQDANVAGAGASDGATQKGVSGFSSESFDVSVNGWVQIKDTGIRGEMLNDDVITDQDPVTSTPAGTDEFLISEGGTLKRIDYSVLIGGADSGVENVIADTDNDLLGISVVNGSTATAKVGLDLVGLTATTAPLTTDILPIYNSSTNKKISVASLATAVTDATSFAKTITDTDTAIAHGLDSTDVIVQLYDVTTGLTVYADVDRVSASLVSVTFGSTPTNSIRVLIQKIIE